MKRKPKNRDRALTQTWWTLAQGTSCIWRWLELHRRDVKERLERTMPDWHARGYRLVKLRVTWRPQRTP